MVLKEIASHSLHEQLNTLRFCHAPRLACLLLPIHLFLLSMANQDNTCQAVATDF